MQKLKQIKKYEKQFYHKKTIILAIFNIQFLQKQKATDSLKKKKRADGVVVQVVRLVWTVSGVYKNTAQKRNNVVLEQWGSEFV